MTSIKDHFFSDRNLQFLYESVRQELNQKHDYDINASPKLRQGFKQIAEAVYIQTNSADRSLTSLNDNLTTKSIAYFGKVIDNKKGRKTNISGNQVNDIEIMRGMSTKDTYNVDLGMSVMNNNLDVSSNLEKLRLDRANSVVQPISQNNTMRGNMNSSMDTNIESRYMLTHQDKVRDEDMGHRTGRQMAEIYEGINNQDFPFDIEPIGQPDVSVLPMLYSSDFLDDSNNSNNIMYNNTDQLKARDSMNPMDLLGTYQQSRDMESKLMNQRPMDNIAEKRNKQLIDSRIDIVSANPQKLLQHGQDITARIINNMNTSTVGDNDNISLPNRKSENERAINTMVNYQIKHEPKYIDKVHYININSIDRNWITQQESRYKYKVNFDQSETQSGAGIASLMKNILSVELINAMLPIDNTPVLFDNRIFLSTQRNPYLLLHIDELDGVFRSTHNASDKVFSQMIFDKEYSSSVLSSDYISSDVVPDPDTRYSSQFNRGYLRYIPAFFEKKTNYNNPMASLNRMTIRITDLYGNLINTESDVLEISTITGEDVANKELVGTIGFPGYDVATATYTTQYIKITTTKYFSNRLFRIGDCIQLSGIITDNGNMTDFINRDSGHIIINLTAETNSATGNKGYINVIYISPPGNLNSSNQTLDYNTYIDPDVTYTSFTSISTGTSIKGYLINKFLQTNLMMKIITRDVDTENIIKSLIV